jgi:hypothetical protein
MIFIFVFRVYDLNKKADEAVRIQQSIVKEKDAEPASPGSKLPSAVSKTNTQADAQVDIDAQTSQRKAFYWAFAIFSLIFLGVQFSGIYLSYSYGFASDAGEAVYGETCEFLGVDDYQRSFEELRSKIDGEAQQALGRLQQLIGTIAHDRLIPESWRQSLMKSGERTFVAYLRMKRDEDAGAAGEDAQKKMTPLQRKLAELDALHSQGLIAAPKLEELKAAELKKAGFGADA